MAHSTSLALFEEKLATIELLLEEGMSEADAAVAAGMSRGSLTRYKQDPEILSRIERAKLRSKAELLRVAHIGATRGFKTKETITTREPVEEKDGTVRLAISKVVEIERELPPDMRTNQSMLRARFPEEFGSINRLDMKKIGSAGQIDQDNAPNEIDNPAEALDLILKGNTYQLPELEDGAPTIEPEFIEIPPPIPEDEDIL